LAINLESIWSVSARQHITPFCSYPFCDIFHFNPFPFKSICEKFPSTSFMLLQHSSAASKHATSLFHAMAPEFFPFSPLSYHLSLPPCIHSFSDFFKFKVSLYGLNHLSMLVTRPVARASPAVVGHKQHAAPACQCRPPRAMFFAVAMLQEGLHIRPPKCLVPRRPPMRHRGLPQPPPQGVRPGSSLPLAGSRR